MSIDEMIDDNPEHLN